MCMFCRSLFVLLTIVMPVLLRYTDSDYPFGIFKLFLIDKKVIAILRGHAHLLTSENSDDVISNEIDNLLSTQEETYSRVIVYC